MKVGITKRIHLFSLERKVNYFSHSFEGMITIAMNAFSLASWKWFVSLELTKVFIKEKEKGNVNKQRYIGVHFNGKLIEFCTNSIPSYSSDFQPILESWITVFQL